jgi:type I restriction enzyme, S subunit
MSDWPMIPLSEVLTRHDDWVNLDPDSEYRQITVRLWGKGLTQRAFVKGSTIAAVTQNRVKTGQFLISKIDARHGAFGLVPPELNGAVVSGDFPSFDVNADRALPDIINWISKTDWFVALCKRASEGSTNRVRLKEDRFLNEKIPLPPINIQRSIVAQLDGLAARLLARQTAAAAVQTELTATLRAAFHRIILNAPRAPMAEVAPLVRRQVTIDPEASYTEIGVKSFYRGIFHRRTLNGSEFTWQKLFRIHEGDLVFSNLMAWEQAIGLAAPKDQGTVGNHRMLTCEPVRTVCNPNFLWYFFTTPEGFSQILEASPGSIARNKTLSAVQLPKITVPTPSLDAQHWFDSLQTKVATIRAIHSAAEQDAVKLLPALLDRAFSGQTAHQQAA